MNMSYEEKIMRELCSECDITWNESAKYPSINGKEISDLNYRELLENPDYLSEYNIIESSIEIEITPIAKINNYGTTQFAIDMETSDAA